MNPINEDLGFGSILFGPRQQGSSTSLAGIALALLQHQIPVDVVLVVVAQTVIDVQIRIVESQFGNRRSFVVLQSGHALSVDDGAQESRIAVVFHQVEHLLLCLLFQFSSKIVNNTNRKFNRIN